MKTIASSVLTAMLGLWAPSAFCADKAPVRPAQYDPKTEIDFLGSIVQVNEVAAADFAGIHLTIQTTNQTTKESLDVFLGPSSFIKMLDMPLKAGLKDVEIIGSKVKVNGSDLVLARLVGIAKTDFALRDKNGVPNWLWTMPPVTTEGEGEK